MAFPQLFYWVILIVWIFAEAHWHSSSTWNVPRTRNFKFYQIRLLHALITYHWRHFSESWPCSCPCASEKSSILNSYGWVLQFWHCNWWLYPVGWHRNSWTVATAFCYTETNPSKKPTHFYFCKSGEHMVYLIFLFSFPPLPSSLIHSSSDSYLSMQWALKK